MPLAVERVEQKVDALQVAISELVDCLKQVFDLDGSKKDPKEQKTPFYVTLFYNESLNLDFSGVVLMAIRTCSKAIFRIAQRMGKVHTF